MITFKLDSTFIFDPISVLCEALKSAPEHPECVHFENLELYDRTQDELKLLFSHLSAQTNSIQIREHERFEKGSESAYISLLLELPPQIQYLYIEKPSYRNNSTPKIFQRLSEKRTDLFIYDKIPPKLLGRPVILAQRPPVESSEETVVHPKINVDPRTSQEIIQSLTPGDTRVNLTQHLEQIKKLGVIKKILQSIPAHIKALLLDSDSFYKMSTRFNSTQLEEIFASLPRALTHLSLSNSKIFKFQSDVIEALFKQLPQHLESINLADTHLFETTEQAYKSLSHLPPRVQQLDLSRNELFLLKNELSIALSHLPENLKHLSLRANRLDYCQENFDTALTRLPQTLVSLDLSWNNLFEVETPYLIQLLSSLPRNLQVLDLSCSSMTVHEICVGLDLSEEAADDEIALLRKHHAPRIKQEIFTTLACAFKHLPPNLTTLNLKHCHLERLSLSEFIMATGNLPPSVQNVSFGAEILAKYEKHPQVEQVALQSYLKSRFQTIDCELPLAQTEILTKVKAHFAKFTEIHPLEMSERNLLLKRIMERFTSSFNPQHHLCAYFVCQCIENPTFNIDEYRQFRGDASIDELLTLLNVCLQLPKQEKSFTWADGGFFTPRTQMSETLSAQSHENTAASAPAL